MHFAVNFMKRYIFLLGGWDLEMITIRKILQKRGYKYFDNHLSWNNANLSSYSNILSHYGNQPGYTIVGIELVGATDYNNYLSIYHHNQLYHLPSSIEQSTNLLNIELSYFYKIVAANDKGYIPAMQKVGVNSFSIKRIRALDRHI